jgi:hypothetical protein
MWMTRRRRSGGWMPALGLAMGAAGVAVAMLALSPDLVRYVRIRRM